MCFVSLAIPCGGSLLLVVVDKINRLSIGRVDVSFSFISTPLTCIHYSFFTTSSASDLQLRTGLHTCSCGRDYRLHTCSSGPDSRLQTCSCGPDSSLQTCSSGPDSRLQTCSCGPDSRLQTCNCGPDSRL